MQLDQNLHEISKGRIFSGIDSIQYVIVIYEFILKTKHCRPWAKTSNAQPYWKSVVHLAPADSLKPSNLTADDGGSWNLFKQKFISVITLPTQWPHTRISAGTAILLSRMHTWKSMASSEDTVPTPSRSSTIKHPRHLAVDTVTLDPVITSIMNSFSVVSCGVFQKKKKKGLRELPSVLVWTQPGLLCSARWRIFCGYIFLKKKNLSGTPVIIQFFFQENPGHVFGNKNKTTKIWIESRLC